ncbi:MAG: serine/threonine-protein kinase [Gemmataceae bacterium]|nr:serine/threonine-protein kinase [Gemmataceae bacterium]
MNAHRAPETTAAGSDPVSELLYRWERDRQAGRDVTPADLCRDTPELLDEVTRRVRALEVLYGVPNRPSDTPAPAGLTLGGPPVVPGYEVGEELGRGGMGVVWQARDVALGRPVALKMLPGGAGHSAQARARFQVEAEAAAGLHHPHIVQVYEVGEAGGCPYLALEYVAGGTLADRLAAGPLPFADAAELVETVARAVDHAHRHGVLHRDLKPANILLAVGSGQSAVGSEDTKPGAALPTAHRTLPTPTPKVADFGLAKRLGSDGGATRTGDVLGTPAYMPPEQAAGRTAEVGVAGDVYALGGILYCCLTGRPPFDGGSPLETLSQVVNQDPVPPSRLRPGCPRDLEVIALKCLRKDPGKRYATAAELADDLGRWRAGEPIRARPVRLPERLWLWAKRRPGLAAMAAAMVALAVGSVAGLTALYLKAEKARAEAVASYDAAQTTIGFFVADVFPAADPAGRGGLGADVPLLRAVERALPVIEAKFADHPAAEASLRDALGLLYHRAGDDRAAVAQYERCAAIRRALGPADPDTLRTEAVLADVLSRVGRAAEAEALLRRVLADQTAALGADGPDAAETENTLGMVLSRVNRPDEAEPLYAHALAVRERHLGPDDPLTQEPLLNLALAYEELGRPAEAQPLRRRASAAMSRLAPTHPDRLLDLHGQVVVLIQQGKFVPALAEAEALLELQRAGLSPDHPNLLGTENLIGLALRGQDRPADAERHLRRAYDGYRGRPGDDPTARLPAGTNLAFALLEQGKTADAEPLTRELLEVARAAADRAPEYLAGTLFVRGRCLLILGRAADSLPLAREARAIHQKGPPGDLRAIAADTLLGACLAEAGEVAEAEPLLVAGYDALADHPNARPSQRRDAADRLARLYEKTGRPEKVAEVRATIPAR